MGRVSEGEVSMATLGKHNVWLVSKESGWIGPKTV